MFSGTAYSKGYACSLLADICFIGKGYRYEKSLPIVPVFPIQELYLLFSVNSFYDYGIEKNKGLEANIERQYLFSLILT